MPRRKVAFKPTKVVKIKYIRGRKYISVNGELFIHANTKTHKDDHIKEMEFKPVDKKRSKEYKKKVEYLVKTLKDKVSIKDVLRHKFYDMSIEDLNALIDELKKKPKIKKRYGCLSIQMGNEEVELVG